MGDPISPETQIGSLARKDLLMSLKSQIDSGLNFLNGYESNGEKVESIYGGEFDESHNTVSPLVVQIPTCQVPFGLNYTEDPEILKPYSNYDKNSILDSNVLLREEVFGPVFPIVSYPQNDIDLAVFVANSTEYGLGSGIVSQDLKKAEEISRRIQAGLCFINQSVGSFSDLPCGGERASGWGRDCGRHGFEAFGNVKTIWIQK